MNRGRELKQAESLCLFFFFGVLPHPFLLGCPVARSALSAAWQADQPAAEPPRFGGWDKGPRGGISFN